MIKAFAQKIAVIMGVLLQVEQDRLEIFSYGLEIILGTFAQLALLLSLIMDTFITIMVCLIAFASLCYYRGGTHLNTYYGCLTVGISLCFLAWAN
ncbi:accessory gene regulator B family protein [Desulfofarcimen acetoxidans]|jgi:accessory gene regulator B|uniref:accessory gene regulator B family protein n=1 Tax=Desulfofarcimen acetoxidans TaxID=58138 RepID=UPI0009FDD6B6